MFINETTCACQRHLTLYCCDFDLQAENISLTLNMPEPFACLISPADFWLFSKNEFRNTIRVSNSLDPDQARHNIGPDLGPNYFTRLLADDTSRQRVKSWN